MVPPYNPNDPFNAPIPNADAYGMPVKKKKRLWLWITLGVLIPLMLCGAGIGGCAYWAISSTRPAFDATNNFYKAATRGQDIKPYICNTRDADEMIQDFDNATEQVGKITKYSFHGYANNNGEVTTSGDLVRESILGSAESKVDVELVKENGKYKVCKITEFPGKFR